MTHTAPRPIRDDLRWRCSHCLGKAMFLPYAMTHITAQHEDCWCCRVEWMMADAIWNGVGESWFRESQKGRGN